MNRMDSAKKIIKYVGGKENVDNVYHCATRLRFTLINEDKVDVAALESVDGVISVLGKGVNIQVVIGNAVNLMYEEIQKILPETSSADVTKASDAPKGSPIDRLFNIISGIFAPYLPLIMCSGILNGLLTLAASMNWLSAESGTFAILSAAGNAVFYFFPILLSYTAAKQFRTNPYVAVVIGATLIQPTFIELMNAEGAVNFLNIPVIMTSYSSSVLPAILGVWLFSVVDHQLTKILPDSLRSLVITLVGMVVVVPLTILTFGPFGVYVSELLGNGLTSLVSISPIIAGVVAGGLCGYLAIFGLQWGIIPVIIININNQGFDYFTPMWLMATYSQIGLALGVFLKTKNPQLRQLSLSSFLTGIFTGITEPIIYGLLTKYKKLHIPFMTAGAIAGAFVGAFKVKQYSFVFGGVLNFPGFIGETFPFYVAGLLLAIVIAAGMVYLLGFEEESNQAQAIFAPVEGDLIALEDVADKTFASKALGEGIAIIPDGNKIYAPIDGEVTVAFPTGHAFGINGTNGLELLIHVGIDTVNLNGEHFTPKVTVGQKVKQGDLLGEFDLTKIIELGYDPTTMMVVTNQHPITYTTPTNKKVTEKTALFNLAN